MSACSSFWSVPNPLSFNIFPGTSDPQMCLKYLNVYQSWNTSCCCTCVLPVILMSLCARCSLDFYPGSASSSEWNPVGPLTCGSEDATRGACIGPHYRDIDPCRQEQFWIIYAAASEWRLCSACIFIWRLQHLFFMQQRGVKIQNACVTMCYKMPVLQRLWLFLSHLLLLMLFV